MWSVMLNLNGLFYFQDFMKLIEIQVLYKNKNININSFLSLVQNSGVTIVSGLAKEGPVSANN